MRTYQKILAVIALSGMCLAAPVPSGNGGAIKKAKKHRARDEKMEEKPPCETCEAIKRLEEKVAAQQAEIDALKAAQQPQPAATNDEQARQAAASAKQAADAAAAAAAEAHANANGIKTEVSELKASNSTAAQTVQDTQKRVTELENPRTIHYKGVNLTPGGYLAGEMLWRQRSEIADTYSSWNGMPYSTDSRYHQTEFRGSARASRLWVLAQGRAGDVKLSGYYEMDFEGAAPTANENLTSGFNIRSRQLFGQASMRGWTVTGGQTWSLLTLNKRGIMARDEWIPSTIEGDYLPGYTYNRLLTLRVAKSFGEGKATAAFSVENPATLVAPNSAAAITGAPGTVNLQNLSGTFSSNLAPDLIAKIALDPSFGHFEIKAVGRFFRDRVAGSGNNTKVAGGFGAAAIVPVANKKVNLIAAAMAGRGIGRYGQGSNQASADVTIYTSGGTVAELHPLQNLQALGGIEAQVTPKFAWYLYGGEEYIGRDFDLASAAGYGNPALNNAGCFGTDTGATQTNPLPVACPANTKSLLQGTTGFWYNMYAGGFGTLRYGMQYSWTYKTTWADAAGLAPKTSDSMAFSSFRYVLP